MKLRRLWVLHCLLAVAGCGDDGSGFSEDAGPRDAGTLDAAEGVDATAPEAGVTDAAMRDAGPFCDPGCGLLEACCRDLDGSSGCRSIVDDPDNCGGCDVVCPSGTCVSGGCVPLDAGMDAGTDAGMDAGAEAGVDAGPPDGGGCGVCPSSQRCCGDTCVNRRVTTGTDGRSDPSFTNCNGCGIECDPTRASACSTPFGTSGPPRCMCGAFDQCPSTDACIVGPGGTFQCVNLSTDDDNCGAVGHVCPGEESCIGGTCVCGSTGAGCGSGETCCGGSCIATDSDPDNCGGCAVVCAEQGGDACVGGACRCGSGPACTPSSGSDLGELCCSGGCVTQSDTNCGHCGAVCEDDTECVLGMDLSGASSVCCARPVAPGIPAFCIGDIDGGPLPGFDGGV